MNLEIKSGLTISILYLNYVSLLQVPDSEPCEESQVYDPSVLLSITFYDSLTDNVPTLCGLFTQ